MNYLLSQLVAYRPYSVRIPVFLRTLVLVIIIQDVFNILFYAHQRQSRILC